MTAFALRKAFAALVLLVAVFAVFQAIRIAQYREWWPDYRGCYLENEFAPGACRSWTPWWATVVAVALGVFGLALAAVVYPRRDDRSSESWGRGFRAAAAAERRARRRRRFLSAAVVVLVFGGAAVAALGSLSPNGAGRASQTPGSVTFVPASANDSPELMSQLVLPPGAQLLRFPPRGGGPVLHQPEGIPGAALPIAYRLWRVHRTLSSTSSFVEGRLPRGAQWEGSGSLSGGATPPNEFDTYVMPTGKPVDGQVSAFYLDLAFVSLPHGWTGIRADALIPSGPIFRN